MACGMSKGTTDAVNEGIAGHNLLGTPRERIEPFGSLDIYNRPWMNKCWPVTSIRTRLAQQLLLQAR